MGFSQATWILVGAGACQIALGWLGIRVSTHPPQTMFGKRLFEITFVAIGLLGLGLIIWDGSQNSGVQSQTAQDAHTAATQSVQINQKVSKLPVSPFIVRAVTPQTPPKQERPRIKPLVAYRQTDVAIQTTPDGSSIRGFNMIISNVSDEALSGKIVSERILLDGKAVIDHGCEGDLGTIQQTMAATSSCTKNDGDYPIPSTAKAIVVEFEVSYDTIPPTGVRRSFRQWTVKLNWANGPKSAPLLEGQYTKEWDKP